MDRFVFGRHRPVYPERVRFLRPVRGCPRTGTRATGSPLVGAHQCGPNAIHPAGLRGAACWIRKKRGLYTSVTEPLPFSGALSIPPTRGSCVMSVERTGQPCHGIPRPGDKDGHDGMDSLHGLHTNDSVGIIYLSKLGTAHGSIQSPESANNTEKAGCVNECTEIFSEEFKKEIEGMANAINEATNSIMVEVLL